MSEEETKKLLELFDPKDKVILDVGCGDGRYASVFSKYCKEYVGIDINREIIDANNNDNTKSNVFYEVADIVKYNGNQHFDIILLSLAFHEIDIKCQGLALINMLRLLNANGIIIILDPAFENDSFQALWNIAYDSIKFYNHDYSVRHSQEVIQKALENNLCSIVKKDSLAIPFNFETINEIYEMIVTDDDFKDVMWDSYNKEKLYDCLCSFLHKKENITIYDKLDITILEKVDD